MECYNCGAEVSDPLVASVEETVYYFCCDQCLCGTDVLEEHLDNLIMSQVVSFLNPTKIDQQANTG